MQVDVLGPLRVRVDDREIDLGGPRNRALVARLALDAGRPVGAATLIDDLWGTEVPADATNALQSIVSRTRRRLPSDLLGSTSAGYVLNADVDATEFERLLAEGHTGKALALWRGEALADVDAPFAAVAAARLTELRLGALTARLGRSVDVGADAAIVAELAGLTASHPYREGLWALYLTALADTGRPGDALNAYERMRGLLADELGTDPSVELQALHVAILNGVSRPKPRSAGRLPVGVTSFVGRDEAIAVLGDAFGEHRLITVLGPGGAGKTRLSIEAARAHADRFDDIWLVELAPVTGGDDIRTAILAAMGLLEVSVHERTSSVANRPDVRDKLLEAVQDSPGLLILDNCEHLIDDVAAIAEELLSRAARLTILTTSREPLRIIGEFGYQVSSLAQPPQETTPEQATAFSAVQLFLQRAAAVDQSFALDAGTLPGVLEICSRLDGQPLAIELAAARLRTLTVQQVAARLSDRFRLLTGGSRTSLPRHRTLRAVVQWSWDLLSDEERELAERVAVFPGGVTVESARAVCGGDVAELLESLADKSLLVPVRGRVPRFRMLETLREFGIERLIDRGIVQDVRSAHLDHFLDHVERCDPLLRGPDQLEGFAALDEERGNISAALRFAVDREDRARAVRMTAALAWYWSTRSQHEEAATWGLTVIELPGEGDPVAETICATLGITALFLGQDTARIDSLIEGILDRYDARHHDHPIVDLILSAIHLFGKGAGRTPPHPRDTWTLAAIDLMQNVAMENAGRVEDPIALLDRAIDGFTAVGDRWGLATALAQRGNVEAADGRFDAARDSWERAIALLQALGADEDVVQTQLRLTTLQIRMRADGGGGEIGPYRDELLVQVDQAKRNGSARGEIIARMGLAQVERVAGDHDATIVHLQAVRAAIETAHTFGGDHMRAVVMSALAMVQTDLGAMDAAFESLRQAIEAGVSTKDMPVVAQVAVAAAWVAAGAGHDRLAAERLGAADRIRGQADLMNWDAMTLAEQLREDLGDDGFEAGFAAGLGLDQDAAIELLAQTF